MWEWYSRLQTLLIPWHDKQNLRLSSARLPTPSLIRGRLRWSHPLPHTRALVHTQGHLPSFLFIPHSISLVFTFLFSRDIYYSSHPPFDINYHIVSPFISLSPSRRGNPAAWTIFSPLAGDDSLSARPSICSSLACPSVISLRGRQPVRGTWPRLLWAWPCI